MRHGGHAADAADADAADDGFDDGDFQEHEWLEYEITAEKLMMLDNIGIWGGNTDDERTEGETGRVTRDKRGSGEQTREAKQR